MGEGDNDILPVAEQPAGIADSFPTVLAELRRQEMEEEDYRDRLTDDEVAELRDWLAGEDRGPYITTYTGRFYPFDPRPEDVRIEDIIHSLSVMQRYTGHGRKPYSVAEHSVHIYRWLVAQAADLDTRLAGLLHDAPEALSGFGDVARPAKNLAPLIGSTERAIWEQAIAPRFELPAEMPEVVHEADTRICADEMSQNLHEVDPTLPEPLGFTLEFWDVDRAKAEFWRAFEEVQRQRQQEVGKRRAA